MARCFCISSFHFITNYTDAFVIYGHLHSMCIIAVIFRNKQEYDVVMQYNTVASRQPDSRQCNMVKSTTLNHIKQPYTRYTTLCYTPVVRYTTLQSTTHDYIKWSFCNSLKCTAQLIASTFSPQKTHPTKQLAVEILILKCAIMSVANKSPFIWRSIMIFLGSSDDQQNRLSTITSWLLMGSKYIWKWGFDNSHYASFCALWHQRLTHVVFPIELLCKKAPSPHSFWSQLTQMK